MLTAAIVLGLGLLVMGVRRVMRHALPRQQDGVTPELLTRWFRELLTSAPGSVVVLNFPGTPLTLQFRNQRRIGESGIQFEFPKAEWSSRYFEQVRAKLAHRGYDPVLYPADTQRKHDHIVAWFGSDVEATQQFAWDVFSDIYNVSPERCRAFLPSAFERSGK